ncbi:tetratricopeptide repeat-containing sensor histidine kinase [Geofilum sp. OHC36d9]|uniref:tetratricopeptide repeat-containing sensor histidine kinase n=1 Tax=Geofilum sp. OHC36d9 TaxID=3458413 RepID=UPI0040335FBA
MKKRFLIGILQCVIVFYFSSENIAAIKEDSEFPAFIDSLLKIQDSQSVEKTSPLSAALTKAIAFQKRKEYKEALTLFEEIEVQHKEKQEITYFIYEQKAHIFCSLKEYSRALNYSHKAIAGYEKVHNTEGLSRIYKRIGLIHNYTKNFNKGIDALTTSLDYAKATGSPDLIVDCLATMATTYLLTGNFQESIKINTQILKFEQISDSQRATVLFNLGSSYLSTQAYEQAQENYNKSLALLLELEDTTRIINTKNNLAHIYLNTGKWTAAEKIFKEVLLYGKATNNYQTLVAVYYNLTNLYGRLQKPDSVLRYLDLYSSARDSIWNETTTQTILELEQKYQAEEQQQQIAILQKEEQLSKAQIRTQRVTIMGISAISILLMFFGYIINKQRIKLKKGYQLLEKGQKEIVRINGELNQSIAAKNRLLSIVGHDLRGPIHAIRDISELYQTMEEPSTNEIKEFIGLTYESTCAVSLLLENLLTWANSQKGAIAFTPVEIQIKPLLNQIVMMMDKTMNRKNIIFSLNVADKLVLTADPQMLKTILRNLLSNAIKFSPENTTINISAAEKNNFIEISVEDQGCGMSQEQLINLFDKKETFFLEGKNNVSGSGLGLILCKDFVERHGGTIKALSQQGVGTNIIFTLPKIPK